MKHMLRLTTIFTVLLFFGGSAWGQETIFSNDCSSLPTGWSNDGSQESGYYLIYEAEYVTTTSYDLSGYTELQLVSNLRSYGNGTAPECTIEISTDGGSTWTGGSDVVSSIPNSYTNYTWDIGTVSSSNVKIRWYRSNGTRGLRVNDLELTGTISSGPDNPESFTATASNTTQIDLAATANGETDDILVAYNSSNTFGTPDGTYSVGNSIAGGGTVHYVGAAAGLTNHTGLSAGQTVYYKAWSVNGSTEYSSGVEADATTLKTEPTAHASGFDAVEDGTDKIIISWTDAVGASVPDGYLIKANSTGTFDDPVDGTDPTVDDDLSDGSALIKVMLGEEIYEFSGLTANTQYFFKSWSYTNSGSNIDFKTDGTVPDASATTNPEPPGSLTLTVNGSDEINVAWTKNGNGDDILVVYDLDGSFTDPVNGNTYAVSSSALGGTVIYNGSGTSYDHSGLLAETIYAYKIWSVSEFDTYSTGLDDFTETAKAEPSNHVTNFLADAGSPSQSVIDLIWDDATAGVQETAPDGYLIQAETDGIFDTPSDGTDPGEDTDLSDGSALVKVAQGEGSHSFTGLSSSTNYFFKIWPYTNSGSFIDFKTDGVVPVTTAKTDDAPSGGGTSTLLTVDFETANDGYTPSTTEGSSPNSTDIFNRTNPDIGGNSSYIWAVEDLSVTDPFITIDQIDITGINTFSFSVDFLTPNTEDWDTTDELLITYSIDGGASQNLLWVQSNEDGDAFNAPAAIDNDFDGTGDDGYDLPAIDDDFNAGVGSNFETFSKSDIAVSGSTLDIKLQFNGLDAAAEGIYLDNIVISGTSPTATTTTWNGGTSSSWTEGTNWSDGVPDASTNVTISGSATNMPTISAAANCNNITLEDGATLVGQENLTVNGNTHVKKHIVGYTGDKNGWNAIATPVSEMDLAGSDFVPLEGIDDFYVYDQVTNYWLNYFGGNQAGIFDQLEADTGYLVAFHPDNAGTKSFAGTGFNNASVSPTISNSNTAWNLSGNPYPSKVTWADVTKSNVSSPKVLSSTTGEWLDLGTELEVAQGLFVYAEPGSASLTFETADQTHGSTKKSGDHPGYVKLLAGFDNDLSVQLLLQANENASDNYEWQHDARYFYPVTSIPYLCAATKDDVWVSKYVFDSGTETTIIPVRFTVQEDQQITFSIENFETNFGISKLTIEDTKLNVFTVLSDGNTYEFTATPEDDPLRFKLHAEAGTGIHEATIEGLNIYTHNNSLYLNSDVARDAAVEMYNVTGQQVYAKQVVMNGLTQINPNLKTGWYVVKVSTEEGMATEKVFIK